MLSSFLTAASLAMAAVAQGSHPVASVLTMDLPGETPQLVQGLTEELTAAGFNVARKDLDAFEKSVTAAAGPLDLLVLPDAGHLPTAAAAAIDRFVRDGGKLIALQTPMWGEPMIRTEAGWIGREACQRQRAAEMPEHVLFRFEPGDIRDWMISRYPGGTGSSHETVADSPTPRTRALHITGDKLIGWDAGISLTGGIDHAQGGRDIVAGTGLRHFIRLGGSAAPRSAAGAH